MPQGHAPKREVKKSKKKPDKPVVLSTPVFTSTEVEVIRKRRKPREEDKE